MEVAATPTGIGHGPLASLRPTGAPDLVSRRRELVEAAGEALIQAGLVLASERSLPAVLQIIVES